MFLKRLEIFGFKSFADKTILNFEPGITSIVGPNGCGKSNIFDAIRWVLGEQSVKELRGGSMEDVIFNGTDKKPGLGFTEVSLSFSNELRALPVDYDEVTVTRRLFRSGESEYLLNKTVVRLKDILELFMGTGVGAEAYSLVQQGKVDLIVSSRPEDRRIILDEASGITKYKSKKKEALNKLKDTEDNLLRINDIILEVKRQIGSLERQANKARKYKEEFEKLKGLEGRLAQHELDGLYAQQKEIQANLEQLSLQEKHGTDDLANYQNLLEEENVAMAEVNTKITEVHQEDVRLENFTEMNQKQIQFDEERVGELKAREARVTEQKAQLQKRCETEQLRIDSSKNELVDLGASLEENSRALQVKRERLKTINHTIHQTKESIRQQEERTVDMSAQEANVHNELTEVMKQFQGALARKHRLEIEQNKVLGEKQEVDGKLNSITAEIDGCLTKLNGLKGDLEAKTQTIQTHRQQFNELEAAKAELEKNRLFLHSQEKFIEELRVQYHDIPDPINEGVLLTEHPPAEIGKGILGKVKDVQAVAPEHRGVLQERITGIKPDSALFQVTCETKFVELDPGKITIQISELTQKIEFLEQQMQSLAQEINQSETELTATTTTIHDQEKGLSKYETQKHSILEEINKLSAEMGIIESELGESRHTLGSLKTKEGELNGQLQVIEEGLHAIQSSIQNGQEAIAALSQERESTTVTIAQLETEISSQQDKCRAQQDNLKIFEENLAGHIREIQHLDEEVIINQGKIKTLAEEITAVKIKIDETQGKRQALLGTLDEYQKQRSDINGRLEEIQKKIQSIEREIESFKTTVHDLQMKVQQIVFSAQSIKDRLIQSYKLNIDEFTANIPSEEVQWDALTAEVDVLKKRCDAFGSVNLVAIEEFDQLRERFEFLTRQQADLLTAKESLMNTIYKINSTTRQMFMETFTKVSEEFRIYFRMLFGGGEAQLVLVDPENVLESGIEIIARPPGKKLQSISLLSGGEKSLAAIALVFGVFKVRPSPFCILDEIDAALDESNVGRFGYLLKDFAKIAQFIVITHNKKTMVAADVMYGITMQETGVSKIVSVKFAEDKKEVVQEEAMAV